jgi:hypothetical protein
MNMAVEVHAPSQPVLVVGVFGGFARVDLLLRAWEQHEHCILADDTSVRRGVARHRCENVAAVERPLSSHSDETGKPVMIMHGQPVVAGVMNCAGYPAA